MMYSRTATPLTLEQVAQYAPSSMAIAPHESRSDRYTYIPTREVIVGMQDAGFSPYSATQSRTRDESRKDFTKHMIRFRRMADMSRQAIVGELVPEIVMVNAHDGTAAYNLMAGIWRFVCGNGMMVSDSMLASVHIQHKGDIVGQVIEGSLAIASHSDKALDTIKTWQNLQLTQGEQSAFAESAHILRFADAEGKVNTPITAAQLLQVRRMEDSGKDLWRTFNRVQENVIKGGLSARTQASVDAQGRRIAPRRVSTREVKGIDQDVKLNRSLWHLAERMAELKSAA